MGGGKVEGVGVEGVWGGSCGGIRDVSQGGGGGGCLEGGDGVLEGRECVSGRGLELDMIDLERSVIGI